MLAILCHPERWRLIASQCPPDVPPVADAAHRIWMVKNTHRHAHQEVVLFLRGEGRYGFQGEVYPCAPGTALFLDAFEEHDLNYPPWAADGEHLWIAVTREHAIARLLSVRNGRAVQPDHWHYLLGQPAPADVVAPHTAALRRFLVLSRVVALVAALVTEGYRDPADESLEMAQRRLMATICRHIADTAGKGANLDHLARLAGYSKFHFLRIFKQHTGQSVHAYIDACRVRSVTAMLHAGYSKKAIAAALGFSCPAAFSRWHRKQQGSGEVREHFSEQQQYENEQERHPIEHQAPP